MSACKEMIFGDHRFANCRTFNREAESTLPKKANSYLYLMGHGSEWVVT